jgi:hypothetical protein
VGRAPLAVVHARPAQDARTIRAGLTRAVRAGRLSKSESARYRMILRRARATLTLLPATRRMVIERVLGLVRLQARRYDRPRALALFTMLEQNAAYLSTRPLPRNETDVVGRDGIVYRVGWGYGLQFHPLANAAALNNHILGGRNEQARRLATALAARAVSRRTGAVLEYYFPFGSGRPPWTSGMAQAAAAQAFARAFERFGVQGFATAATRAYRSIPAGLVLPVSAQPWIRHYSFSRLVVLNAHMQAIVSITDYARIMGDQDATGLAGRFAGSAKSLLPRFDTGHWTLYSLGGAEARLNYHVYHVELARLLAQRTGDAYWTDVRQRFARYTNEPPAITPGTPVPVLYPWPSDGFRDTARLGFRLSKISRVTVRAGGKLHSLGYLPRGWHTFAWRPGRIRAREYRPVVDAVDLAGNPGSGELQPVTVAVDREPPVVNARVAKRRLVWRAVDPTSPWVRMRAVLRRAGKVREIRLGVRPKRGSLVLGVPRGTWRTVLWVADSSGNSVRLVLGPVPAPPRR